MRHQADRVVDTSGTFCPVPIIETAKAAREEGPGKILLIIATDPGIESDLPVWCKGTRNELLGIEREGERFLGWIRLVEKQ